jgi:hypothetical protein
LLLLLLLLLSLLLMLLLLLLWLFDVQQRWMKSGLMIRTMR